MEQYDANVRMMNIAQSTIHKKTSVKQFLQTAVYCNINIEKQTIYI